MGVTPRQAPKGRIALLRVRAKKEGASEGQLQCAAHGIQKLKTTRHPNVLVFIDSVDTDTQIYLVTESVQCLAEKEVMREMGADPVSGFWGLNSVLKALSFLHDNAGLVHGGVTPEAVFVTHSGDWKLGMFDFVTPVAQIGDHCHLARVVSQDRLIPERYLPPELTGSRPQWGHLTNVVHCADMYSLGATIYSVYNCPHGGSFEGADDLQDPGRVNAELRPGYQRLVAHDPVGRPTAARFLAAKMFRGPVMQALSFVDEFSLKSAEEKALFFTTFPEVADEIPGRLSSNRILPVFLQACEFGTAQDVMMMLPVVLQLTKKTF